MRTVIFLQIKTGLAACMELPHAVVTRLNLKARSSMKERQWVMGITFLVLGLLLFHKTEAQQLPIYSQYTFNAFLLNPAVAGAEGYTTINVTARQQWVGVEGAPSTQCLSIQTRLMKRNYIESDASVKVRYVRPLRSGRVGLGAYIFNDHIGLTNQTGAQFTYAYHMATSRSQLSFGLTLSLFQFRINTTNIRLPDPKDNLVDNEPLSMVIPDANVGIYFTDQHKFLGFSIFNLSEASIMFGKYKDTDYRLKRHYYATGGFNYDLDDVYTLEPSIYLKTSEQWKVQADLMLKLVCDRKFWIGLGTRDIGTFIGTIGVKLTKLYVGYSYDYSLNGLSYYSQGTHELMLALKLGDNVRRYKWMERY
jgi:type IX secretion system PorP/SprF family membrane protein